MPHSAALELKDLTFISGWGCLKEAYLPVRVKRRHVKENPPRECENLQEKFFKLKDDEFLPRLKAELKRNLVHLQWLVVNGAFDLELEHYGNPIPRWLVFASKCGLGKLHFVSYPKRSSLADLYGGFTSDSDSD